MEKHYIGIDIGGTNLRLALVRSNGVILYRSRTNSGIADGRGAFCSRLLSGIEELRAFAVSQNLLVSGIGVGVPGLVGSDGIIYSSVNMRPLDGFNLASFLEQATGLYAICGNDANVIGMGEYVYGAGCSFSTFAVISIGTGLGSALVLDGRLWTGADGFAAEFGHLTVKPDGLSCPCGNNGCLEQYVSAGAIVRYAEELGFSGSSRRVGQYDAAMLAGWARDGDVTAQKAFQAAGMWLGIALASLANTLNLQAVIVCGGVADSLDLILPALSDEFKRRCFPEISANLKIIAGQLGDDAGLLGAAGLVRSSFLKDDF